MTNPGKPKCIVIGDGAPEMFLVHLENLTSNAIARMREDWRLRYQGPSRPESWVLEPGDLMVASPPCAHHAGGRRRQCWACGAPWEPVCSYCGGVS
jgi:hypothetical protein